MGAWGHLAFDNDQANDWAYDLEDVNDLSLVESTLIEVEAAGKEYLDATTACHALAACEVLARLLNHPGYKNAYTAKVDKWVATHKLTPTNSHLKLAKSAIDRILDKKSELRELWDEGEDGIEWQTSVNELRARLIP